MRLLLALVVTLLCFVDVAEAQAPAGAKEIALPGTAGGARSLLFTKDGAHLLVGRKLLVERYDLNSMAPAASEKVPGGVVAQLLPNSSDRSAVVAAAGTTLTVLDAETLKASAKILGAGPEPRFYAVDEGAGLVALAAGTEVKFFQLESGAPADRPFSAPSAPLAAFALSPDGAQVAYAVQGASAGDIVIVDAKTGNTVRTIRGQIMNAGMPAPAIAELTFSPDSKQLAATIGLGPTRIYDPASGRMLNELTEEAGVSATFSPDGRFLARVTQAPSMARTVTIFDPAKGEKLKSLPMGNTAVNAVTFSVDGRRVAVAVAKMIYIFELDPR
jgi:WD40 repeat protein